MMADGFRAIIGSILHALSPLFTRRGEIPSERLQGVIIHDPDSQKPKDLDNPFYSAKSQERLGEFIARSTVRKTPQKS
jgi:hypothetical protein